MAIEVGSAYIAILPSLKGLAPALSKDMTAAGAAAGTAAGKEAGGKFKSAMKTAGIGAGIAVAAGLVVAVKEAAKLDSQMREVVTLFGETGNDAKKSLGEVSGIVRNLSDEFGTAQQELTSGLYSAISAGVPKKNALTFMQVASKAAIGGVTDTETAVDGLSTVINAFGLKASDAQSVADSMFTAVKGGKTNFEELSASLFNIAPAAAAANVGMEEVNAGIATLTASGTPTSVATTQMRAALTGLQRPSKEMDKIFGKLGFKNAQLAIKSEGLGFALDAVKDASGGNNGELQKLLGSVEAVAAANVIAGTGAKKFSDEMDAQKKKSGAVNDAFQTVSEGVEHQFGVMTRRLKNVGLSIGQFLLPLLNKGLGFLSGALKKIGDAGKAIWDLFVNGDFTGAFSDLFKVQEDSDLVAFLFKARDTVTDLGKRAKEAFTQGFGFLKENKELLLGVVAGLVAAKLALIAYNSYIKITTALTKGWAIVQKLLNGTMKANPIGIVVTVLGLLVGALVAAYAKSETFREIVDKAFTVIGDTAKWLWEKAIKPAFKAIGVVVTWLWKNIVKPYFKFIWAYWTTLAKVVKFGWDKIIKPVFKALWEVVKFLWQGVVKPVFKFIWAYWQTLGKTFKFVWDKVLKPVFEAAKKFITKTLPDGFKTGLDAIKDKWEWLKDMAKKPVRFLIETVWNNGLRKMLNWFLPESSEIPAMGVPFAKGGAVTGGKPGKDSVRAWLMPGEHVLTTDDVNALGGQRGAYSFRQMLHKRKDGDFGVPKFGAGGALTPEQIKRAQMFAESQAGMPYVWGSAGPGGYDCSGFMSAIVNVLRGVSPHSRLGATATFPWSGFRPGPGEFTIGSTPNYGGTGIGHMAGTLAGLNVESRGGTGVLVGAGARGYSDPGFTQAYHLGKGGAQAAKQGGLFSIISSVKDLIGKVRGAINTLKDMLGPWATWLKDGVKGIGQEIVSWINGKIPFANPIPSIFDNGGVLQPGMLAYNASRKPEAVFNHSQFKAFATAGSSAASRTANFNLHLDDGSKVRLRGYVSEIASDTYNGEQEFSAMRGRMNTR